MIVRLWYCLSDGGRLSGGDVMTVHSGDAIAILSTCHFESVPNRKIIVSVPTYKSQCVTHPSPELDGQIENVLPRSCCLGWSSLSTI